MFYQKFKSPVGTLNLYADESALLAITWPLESEIKRVPLIGKYDFKKIQTPILKQCAEELEEYFAKERKIFSVPISFKGTCFQQNIWNSLLSIPYGSTRSYLDIAKEIKNPGAVRAVGSANGCNPLSIVVPCHRVIASNGDLAGFAGGLKAKQFLLQLEKSVTK